MSLSSLSDLVFTSSIVAKAVLSWFASILGTGKSHRGLILVNTMAEAWLRCCFRRKNYEQAMTSEQVKIQQFWNELRCHTLQTQNIRKIEWHEPIDMPTSSETSLKVIRRFSITIFFTASVFSLVVDVLGRPGERRHSPLLDLLWRACTLVNIFWLTGHSPYVTFNILSIFEHLIPSFTQNLMHILWSIFFDGRKSPTHAKHF